MTPKKEKKKQLEMENIYTYVPRYRLFKKEPYYASQRGVREKKDREAVRSYRKEKPR